MLRGMNTRSPSPQTRTAFDCAREAFFLHGDRTRERQLQAELKYGPAAVDVTLYDKLQTVRGEQPTNQSSASLQVADGLLQIRYTSENPTDHARKGAYEILHRMEGGTPAREQNWLWNVYWAIQDVRSGVPRDPMSRRIVGRLIETTPFKQQAIECVASVIGPRVLGGALCSVEGNWLDEKRGDGATRSEGRMAVLSNTTGIRYTYQSASGQQPELLRVWGSPDARDDTPARGYSPPTENTMQAMTVELRSAADAMSYGY
jgi:hypothetical protein